MASLVAQKICLCSEVPPENKVNFITILVQQDSG